MARSGASASSIRRANALRPASTQKPQASTNETTVAEQRLGARVPPLWQYGGSGLCIGYDEGLPVTDAYRPPFACTGAAGVIACAPSSSGLIRSIGSGKTIVDAFSPPISASVWR